METWFMAEASLYLALAQCVPIPVALGQERVLTDLRETCQE